MCGGCTFSSVSPTTFLHVDFCRERNFGKTKDNGNPTTDPRKYTGYSYKCQVGVDEGWIVGVWNLLHFELKF